MPHRQNAAPTVTLREVTATTPESTIADAKALMLEYGRFVIAQPGAAQFCFGSLEQEAAQLPSSYLSQAGGSLIAHVAEQPAGFVAWRALPAEVAEDAWELKRLWVRPIARGLGLGRTLTLAVLDRARSAGRRAVLLDTAPAVMAAAHRLYLDLGFEPTAAYNDNRVEGLAWLKKAL